MQRLTCACRIRSKPIIVGAAAAAHASFTVAYRAHDASKACSLFSTHGRVLVVQQVESVGGIPAGEPATCEDAMRHDFTTGPTVPRLVSIQVNGNRATLNYSGIKGNAVKHNGTSKLDSDLVWA